MINKETIQDILNRTDIADLISETIDLKKSGKNYLGLCPFHNDKTPSFSVNPRKRMFFCFGCRKGGDAISFLTASGRTFGQAVQELADRVGVEIQKVGGSRLNVRPQPRRLASMKGDENIADIAREAGKCAGLKWKQCASGFCEHFHDLLLKNDRVMRWLRRRGIHKKSVVKFFLGVNTGSEGRDLFYPRSAWGLPDECNEKGQKKKLWLPRGLVIPKIDGDGEVGRIRIRLNNNDMKMKYYLVPGSDTSTFWIPGPKRCVTVVESELDAILIHEVAGDLTSVTAMGSSSTRPDQYVFDRLQQAAWIVLVPDFDEAGHSMAAWWVKHFEKATIRPVPVGKDPGDAFKAGINIRGWIKGGLPKAWMIGRSLLNEGKV